MHVVLVQVDLPSWVNFPDYERVNWVNSIVGKVPRISTLSGIKYCLLWLYAYTPTKSFFVTRTA